jgi:hypothetical protein
MFQYNKNIDWQIDDSLVVDVNNEVKRRYHFAIDGTSWALLKQHFCDLIPQVTCALM